MAYVAYSNLSSPDEVLSKMAEYVTSAGYGVVQPLADDLNIYDMSFSDGKKFAFRDRTNKYVIILRSANKHQIFGTSDDPSMDITPIEDNSKIDYTGIGMVVAEGYSSNQRWYNQFRVPKKYNDVDVCGVYMPIKMKHFWEAPMAYYMGDIVEYSGVYYQVVYIPDTTTDHFVSAADNPPDVDIALEAYYLEDPETRPYYKSKWAVCTDPTLLADAEQPTYTLYCNNITEPTDTLVFTLLKENDSYRQVTHLVYSNVEKFENWEGGALFSGTSVKELMGKDVTVYNHSSKISDCRVCPILSSGVVSNAFLRIDVDEAPTDARGNIYWLSSGLDNITGKKFSLPIRCPAISPSVPVWTPPPSGPGRPHRYMVGDVIREDGFCWICKQEHYTAHDKRVNNAAYWEITAKIVGNLGNGKIPHYWWLQSQSRLDWGRNVNTLNCITMDLPIFVAVQVDPDVLENYAAVGNVSGVYCISTLNMQTAGVYERSYPQSGDLAQIFPHGKRRGYYGFDGISIRQNGYS